MAFPTIPTVGGGRVISALQANTTGTRSFPNLSGLTNNSGDLMIAICVAYQSSASAGAVFSSWSAGWTEFADVGGTTSNMSIGAAYKFSTGSETGVITVTQAATITGHASMIIMAIPGAHATAPPEHGAIANATAAAANPASLSPSWGSDDTLWIAVAGSGETATTGSYTGLATAPTNYTNIVLPGITSDVVGGCDSAVSFRQLTATSEDVGTYSVDTSNARNSAMVIAVRPPPFVPAAPVVQSASHQVTSGNCSVTTTAAVSSGTKLIAYVMVSSSAGEPVTSVKDAALNTWTRLKSVQDSSGTGWLELFALDTPAGDVGSTVTLTATCTTNFGVNMLVQEVSGLLTGNTTAMLDGTPATNSGASTGPATTGAYSSAVSGEFLVAMMGDPGFTITVTDSSGYNADRNNINGSSTANLLVDYKASTGGAESASFTLAGGSDHWTTMLGAFQLASTGVSGDVAASTTATITATATAAELGAAAPSTTAAVTATMTATELAAAARSTTATITATATAAELAAAARSTTATVTATMTAAELAAAAPSSTATITATATATELAAAAVSTTATITADGTVTTGGVSGDVTLTTTAAIAAAATAAELAAAAQTATAAITAAATAAELAAASRTSTATITAAATAAELGAATRPATVTITATATAAEFAAATVTTTATITAAATTGAAPISADSALTTTATITATATAAEQAAATGPSATATITAAGTLTARAAAAITTTAAITPAMTAALHAAAALNALAVLTADAGSHPPNVPATSTAAVFAAVTSASSATDPRDGASTVTAAVTSTGAVSDPRDGTASVAAATTSSPTVT